MFKVITDLTIILDHAAKSKVNSPPTHTSIYEHSRQI